MRGPGCQAKPRPSYRNTGWVCDGKGLTIMLLDGDMPCVLPDVMVPDAMQQEWSNVYRPEPFADGDHYHLCAPDVWMHA
jgi:hypothetical protein